jgi:hypothetical protein
LINIEEVWADETVRCIVTNGTISVGVNFDTPGVFDSIHAYYSADIPARDAFQSFRRVRRPISNVIHLLRDKSSFLGHFIDKNKVQFPICPIFEQLRKDLLIEHNANKSISHSWDTFELFAEKTGLTILPANTERVATETAEYIKDLINEAECVFDWNKIPDIPDDMPDEEIVKWMYSVWSSRATLQERLMYLKYVFKKKITVSPENDSSVDALWKRNPHLLDRLRDMWDYDEHIMNLLFAENNVDLSPGNKFTEFPDKMVTSIPMEIIQQQFDFHNPPQDYRTSLVANMINSFFGKRVYTLKKRKRDEEELYWSYETDGNFACDLNTACLYTIPRFKPLTVEMLDDDDD